MKSLLFLVAFIDFDDENHRLVAPLMKKIIFVSCILKRIALILRYKNKCPRLENLIQEAQKT